MVPRVAHPAAAKATVRIPSQTHERKPPVVAVILTIRVPPALLPARIRAGQRRDEGDWRRARRKPGTVTVACPRGQSRLSVPVAMDCGWGECREADGDVLGAIGFRCAVMDPLAGSGHDGLTRSNVSDPGRVLDAEEAAQYNRNLFEVGALPRFLPSAGGTPSWRR